MTEKRALKFGESLEDGSLRWVRRNHFAEAAKEIARKKKGATVLDAVFTNPGPSRLKRFDLATLPRELTELVLNAHEGYTLNQVKEWLGHRSTRLEHAYSTYGEITAAQRDAGKAFLKGIEHEIDLLMHGFNGYKIYKVRILSNVPHRWENAENQVHTDVKHVLFNTISLTRTIIGPSTIYQAKDGKGWKGGERYCVPPEALCAHAAQGALHLSPLAGEDYPAHEPRLNLFVKLISNFPSRSEE